MKYFFIFLFFLLSYEVSFCQRNNCNMFKVAYDYIINSDSIKKGIQRLIPANEFGRCSKENGLFYVCSNLTFINVAEFKELVLPYPGDLGINRNELNNRLRYKEEYYFETYEDSSLLSFNRSGKRFCTYLSFSKIIGRILPLVIFVNENAGNENPCQTLGSIKFGSAFIVFLVFDSTFSSVKAAYYEEILMN